MPIDPDAEAFCWRSPQILWNETIAAASALWLALMAGFFFAFSSAVLPGLSLAAAEEPGMIAMWDINITVRNTLFAAGFRVALALVIGGALLSGVRWQQSWPFLLFGCLVYPGDVFAATATGNVPLKWERATMSAGLAENWSPTGAGTRQTGAG